MIKSNLTRNQAVQVLMISRAVCVSFLLKSRFEMKRQKRKADFHNELLTCTSKVGCDLHNALCK